MSHKKRVRRLPCVRFGHRKEWKKEKTPPELIFLVQRFEDTGSVLSRVSAVLTERDSCSALIRNTAWEFLAAHSNVCPVFASPGCTPHACAGGLPLRGRSSAYTWHCAGGPFSCGRIPCACPPPAWLETLFSLLPPRSLIDRASLFTASVITLSTSYIRRILVSQLRIFYGRIKLVLRPSVNFCVFSAICFSIFC